MKHYHLIRAFSVIMALMMTVTLISSPSFAVADEHSNEVTTLGDVEKVGSEEMLYEGDASISIESIYKKETYVGKATRIIIEKADAPKQYYYEFDNCTQLRIIESGDYERTKDANLPVGGICIVDENNELLNYIEPSKATDSLGKPINSFYMIEENRIIQVIEFDDSSAFPIVVESNSHPTITTTAQISKSKTKSVINKIQSQIDDANNFTGSYVYWIITTSGGYLGGFGIAADAITTWMVKPTFVKRLKARKTLYNGKYKQMASSDKLKVVSVRRWQPHGGNDGRYVLKKETLTIVH